MANSAFAQEGSAGMLRCR